MMKMRFGIFLILTIVSQSVTLELLHHDHLNLNRRRDMAISTNHCDSEKHHDPLDSPHPCVACVHSSIRVSTPATAFEFSPSLLFLSNVIIQNGLLIDTEISISGARSPPHTTI